MDLTSLVSDHYDLQVEKIEQMPEGTNQQYMISTTTGKFVLRKYSSNYYSSKESEILEREFSRFLHIHDAPHLYPVISKSNNLSINVDGDNFSLFPFLPGDHAKPPSINQMTSLGVAIAKMHKLGKNFSSELDFPDRGQKYLVEDPVSTILEMKSKFPHHQKILNYFLEVLETGIGDRSLIQKGIIHADLHLDNILFDDLLPQFIDFDFLGAGFFVYDLATVIWSMIALKPVNAKELLESLLGGYQSIHPLSERELEVFPQFIDLRNVETFVFQYKMSRTIIEEGDERSEIYFSNWEAGIFRVYLPSRSELF